VRELAALRRGHPGSYLVGHFEGLVAVRRKGQRHETISGAVCDGVHGRLSRRVRARAVDVRQALSAERAAAERDARPVVVRNELSAGLAVVAIAAPVQERTVRVDEHLYVSPARAPSRVRSAKGPVAGGEHVVDGRREVEERDVLQVLQRYEHVLERPVVVVLPQPHEQLSIRPLCGQNATRPQALREHLAEAVREQVLGREVADARVVARPTDADAPVVHVAGLRCIGASKAFADAVGFRFRCRDPATSSQRQCLRRLSSFRPPVLRRLASACIGTGSGSDHLARVGRLAAQKSRS